MDKFKMPCNWKHWILLHMITVLRCYFVGCSTVAKMFFGSSPSYLHQTELETLLTTPNNPVILLNSQKLLDFRYFMSVCKDQSSSSAVYTVSFAQCFADSDPAQIFTSYLQLPSLSLTHTCTVNSSFSPIPPHSFADYITRKHIVMPNPSVIIADLALKDKWIECIVIIDDIKGTFPDLDLLLSYLGYLGVRLSLFTVATDVDVIKVMTEIDAWKSPEYTVPFILMCDVNNTIKLLEQASVLGMRRREYMWLVYNGGNATDVLPYLQPSDNVALLSVNKDSVKTHTTHLYENIEKLNQVINITVTEEVNLLGSNKVFPKKGRCKSGISNSLRQKVTANIKGFKFEKHNESSESLYEIKSSITRESGVPEMETVATWDMEHSLKVPHSLFPNAFNGFNKRVFTVASLEYSFFQKEICDSNNNCTWVGLTFQLLDELAKELNFSYEVVTPKDGQWGIAEEDGNWTGMIGMVMKKEVDFAAACFSITAARDEVVDFASPYFHDQSVVVMKRPEHQNRLFLYMFPFQKEVWYGTIAAILLCGPALWLFTYTSPYYKVHIKPWKGRKGLFSLQNSMFYIFGAYMQQGGVFLPDSQSGRVLVGCFWLFVIVIYATYTGNLIAFLAVSTVDMPFATLSQMTMQQGIEWGPAEGVALVMLFRDANFEPYTTVYDRMVPVPSYAEGLRRVKEENYAFISEKSWYQAEAAADLDCMLAMMKEEFYPTSYGWALPTAAPYLGLFSDKINKIRESGLLEKWIQDWTPKNIHCKGLGPITQSKVATVIDFQGALYLLLLGIGISILILAVELGYHLIIGVARRSGKKPELKPNGRTVANGTVNKDTDDNNGKEFNIYSEPV